MTTENYQQQEPQKSNHFSDRRNKRVFFGALVILIGIFILSKRLGLLFLPFHVWPLILLAIGIYIGVKHQFRNFGAWVLIALGILFMIPRFFVFGILTTHLIGPVLIILLGIYLIVKPSRRFMMERHSFTTANDEDLINLDVTFGERTSVVTSKNFKGGIINNTFGSTKINLLQAESAEPVILDLRISFGSVEILIPSHWDLEIQVENSFASVEDKRYLRTLPTEENKILILKGSCSFGSITIKSV